MDLNNVDISKLPADVRKTFKKLQVMHAEKQIQSKARDDFMSFVKCVWPDFIEGSHHRHIAKKFNQLATGEINRLIVNMPPRHTKSEFASYLLPAWMVGREPKLKIIQATHTGELAVRFGRKAKHLIDSEDYAKIFKTTLQEDSKAAGRWETAQGGEYFAAGVGGAITGRGADLLIIDDPHSEQDAMSPTAMESAYEWYTSGPRQRLQPGGKIILVMTRWSNKDLTGKLLANQKEAKADQWHVVSFPAIMEHGSSKAKPVWPEYWKLDELEKVQATLPTGKWNAQWMQNPTAEEGAILKREWWRIWKHDWIPELHHVIQSYDTAFLKKETADYSAITTWGVFYPDQDSGANLMLLDSIKGRYEFPELRRLALEQYKYWQPESVIVEAKASGLPLTYELRQMDIPVVNFTPSRGNDKHSRVNAVAPLFESGMIWAPEQKFADEVIEECAAFPYGDHDDLVDSTTQAIMRFRQAGLLQHPEDYVDEQVERTKKELLLMLKFLIEAFKASKGRMPNNMEMILLRQKAAKQSIDERKVVSMFDRSAVNPNKPIMGGKNIPETEEQIKQRLMDQNKKGIKSLEERVKKNKEYQDLKKSFDDPEKKAMGGRIGYKFGTGKKGVEGLLDLIRNKFGKKSITTADKAPIPSKTLERNMFEKADKNFKNKRMLDDDEYQDFLDEVGGADQLEAYDFDGTVGDAKRIIKEQKRYMDDMELEYKKGNLDPEPGDKSPARKRFLEKKLEEMEESGDKRLMTPDEIEELSSFDLQAEMDVAKTLAPKMVERMQLKQKYPGITDDLLDKILIDDNMQRKAEVLATIDEAFKMMEKGKGTDEILDTMKNVTRTKQADGGITRIGYKAGSVDKMRRLFLQAMGAGTVGVGAAKSGIFSFGKGAGKEVAKEVVQKSTTGSPPPYFFKLAEKIKMLGDDATATTDRTIAKTLKSKDGKSTYVLEEDVSTGDTIIKKINKEGDEMMTDVEIMELKKGEVVMGKDGKPVKVPDEYEEVTEVNARIEGDVFNDPYYSDGIKIDEIIKEIGEQAPSIKKADGGIMRAGYQMGGDVAYDATNQDIYGSSAITVTPDTVMDQFGNQVQAEMGNNYNKPLIPQVTEEAATRRLFSPRIPGTSPIANASKPPPETPVSMQTPLAGSGGISEIDMPIAGGNNNAGGILPVESQLPGFRDEKAEYYTGKDYGPGNQAYAAVMPQEGMRFVYDQNGRRYSVPIEGYEGPIGNPIKSLEKSLATKLASGGIARMLGE